MGYQAYKSISFSDTWPNVACQECGEVILQDPWRRVRIGWTEVVQVAFDLWGIPTGFFSRDFLIVLEFGQIRLVFCGQGPRRGEVEISVPMDDEEADLQLKEFVKRVRAIVEGQSSEDEGDDWENEEEDWEDEEYG